MDKPKKDHCTMGKFQPGNCHESNSSFLVGMVSDRTMIRDSYMTTALWGNVSQETVMKVIQIFWLVWYPIEP